jgi:hypothetical protein
MKQGDGGVSVGGSQVLSVLGWSRKSFGLGCAACFVSFAFFFLLFFSRIGCGRLYIIIIIDCFDLPVFRRFRGTSGE